jgi:VWFA-related protein
MRARSVLIAAVLAASVGSPAKARRHIPAGFHIEAVQDDLRVLDVSVIDKDGNPVTDLRAQDFHLEDNGQPVEIETFAVVPPTNSRMVVLLLDDCGVPTQGTQAIQYIAQTVLAGMRSNDRVSVLRLHGEAGSEGGRAAAAQMIDRFVAGVVPFDKTGTPQHVLETVAAVSRGLIGGEEDRRRRKAIVCIGSQAVCSVPEMMNQDPRGLWPAWMDAVATTAAANVSVYAIVPAQVQFTGGHLPEVTGGTAFATTSEFERIAAQIWNQLGSYYLLGYRPFSSARDLTPVTISAARRGVSLHARRRRGR